MRLELDLNTFSLTLPSLAPANFNSNNPKILEQNGQYEIVHTSDLGGLFSKNVQKYI